MDEISVAALAASVHETGQFQVSDEITHLPGQVRLRLVDVTTNRSGKGVLCNLQDIVSLSTTV
jgi:hypothetical protein